MTTYKVYFDRNLPGSCYLDKLNTQEFKTIIKAFRKRKVIEFRGGYFNMGNFKTLSWVTFFKVSNNEKI